jgi:hypothetical protein
VVQMPTCSTISSQLFSFSGCGLDFEPSADRIILCFPLSITLFVNTKQPRFRVVATNLVLKAFRLCKSFQISLARTLNKHRASERGWWLFLTMHHSQAEELGLTWLQGGGCGGKYFGIKLLQRFIFENLETPFLTDLANAIQYFLVLFVKSGIVGLPLYDTP